MMFFSCSAPTGLEPVAGVEGTLLIRKSIFSSGEVTAVALVVVDKFDADSLASHFITYSDLITPCTETAACDTLIDFFIQLEAGSYLAAPVGLLIPPAEFIASIDSILNAPQLPLKLPGTTAGEILLASKSLLIKAQEVVRLPEVWEVNF